MRRGCNPVYAAILCAIPGVIVGGFMMWVAWEHNPQEEFHSTETGIAWTAWLPIGLSWFIVISGFLALCFLGAHLYGKSRGKQAKP